MNSVDLVVEWSRQRGPDPVEWRRAAWNRAESIWVSLIEFSSKYRVSRPRLEAFDEISKRSILYFGYAKGQLRCGIL